MRIDATIRHQDIRRRRSSRDRWWSADPGCRPSTAGRVRLMSSPARVKPQLKPANRLDVGSYHRIRGDAQETVRFPVQVVSGTARWRVEKLRPDAVPRVGSGDIAVDRDRIHFKPG